jgi:UDP-glucose:(heptosyl)LPS alpha-1,3-glucosyltransferase
VVPATGISNHAFRASYVRNLPSTLDGRSDLVVGFKQMPGLDLYYAGDVCFAAEARCRSFATVRGLMARNRLFRLYERSIFSPNSSTVILELSRVQRDAYIAEYGTPAERFTPIPPGIDKERIRSALPSRDESRKRFRVDSDETMLLMVGSDFKRKGVSRAIRALGSISGGRASSVKLFVVGKGSSASLTSLARGLGVTDQVFFPGPSDDVPSYLSAADALLHPALSENTGNAIVEGLVAGLPVLATSNCGYAFHVERANAGKVVDGLSFRQTAFDAALSSLLSEMPGKKEEWKSNALDYSDATDLYARPKVVADTIERLVEGKLRAG